MDRLTPAEEEVMRVLWDRGEAFVKDLLEDMPEPKPAYTTVSTVVRILEQKGFIGHTAFGRSHRYHPVVDREEYMAGHMGRLVQDHFAGSPKKLLSFFMDKQKLDMKELDELLALIKNKKKR